MDNFSNSTTKQFSILDIAVKVYLFFKSYRVVILSGASVGLLYGLYIFIFGAIKYETRLTVTSSTKQEFIAILTKMDQNLEEENLSKLAKQFGTTEKKIARISKIFVERQYLENVTDETKSEQDIFDIVIMTYSKDTTIHNEIPIWLDNAFKNIDYLHEIHDINLKTYEKTAFNVKKQIRQLDSLLLHRDKEVTKSASTVVENNFEQNQIPLQILALSREIVTIEAQKQLARPLIIIDKNFKKNSKSKYVGIVVYPLLMTMLIVVFCFIHFSFKTIKSEAQKFR